jgi:hypothetical protein
MKISLNNEPRQKLREIVRNREALLKYSGRDILADTDLCQALLLDLCGKHRLEISLLVAAHKELIIQDLQKASTTTLPKEVLLARLTKQLYENLGIAEGFANWAVKSWAMALQVIDPVEEGAVPTKTNQIGKTKSSYDEIEGRETLFHSDYSLHFSGRSSPKKQWRSIGETPGDITIPKKFNEIRVSASVKNSSEVLAFKKQAENLKPNWQLHLNIYTFTDKFTDQDLCYLPKLNNLVKLNCAGDWATPSAVGDKFLLCLDKFSNLNDLNLSCCKNVTDNGLSSLAQLANLKKLDLSSCRQVTDIGVAYLRNLTKIEELSLSGTSLTDISLAHLGSLAQLRVLCLSDTQITDSGLAHLQFLPNLTELRLVGCKQITNEGMRYLARLPKLTKLNLAFCSQLTDAGMAFLCRLSGLEELDIAECTITDRSLVYFQALHSLTELTLTNCEHITNTGLGYLNANDKLTYLNIDGCVKITQDGIAALKQPDLYVRFVWQDETLNWYEYL